MADFRTAAYSEIAARHAGEIPWAVRMLLRGIGGGGGDWRLPSYLNFDRSYCRELIALGHQDAWANADAITQLVMPTGASDAAGPMTNPPPRVAPVARRARGGQ